MDELGLFDVLALEDARERDQGDDFALAVHDHAGDLVLGVEPVLVRRRHHAAAVEATLHRGRQPHLLKGEAFAVDLHLGVGGLVVEQQALDGDGGVVNRLVRVLALTVALLAAIAVDAVADAVDKFARLSLDRHGRQVREVGVDFLGSIARLFVQVCPEIVAAARRVVVDGVFKIVAVDVVDQIVERAVAAADADLVAGVELREKVLEDDVVAAQEHGLFVLPQLGKRLCTVLAVAVVRLLVVNHIGFHVVSPSLSLSSITPRTSSPMAAVFILFTSSLSSTLTTSR